MAPANKGMLRTVLRAATNGYAYRIMNRLLFMLVSIFSMTTPAVAGDLPKEIVQLVSVVKSIKGVSDAGIDKIYLPDIKVTDLGLPGPYADLPIATLRRSKGALEHELLISVNFKIHENKAGLKALEFLSWWVRDQSRGGENMQIRSIGLPPIVGNTKQLGHTLRFTIDWFYTSASQDMSLLLKNISEKAKSIEYSYGVYKSAF